ncbi:MAG: hypothetical protein JXJ18_04660 [Rhodobacteraceae bacterium]|nr:hypothetical protein [Paracoccaceae bacterium]
MLTAALLLGACSTVRESRINPFNWFGGSTEERVALAPDEAQVVDARPLVEQVTEMAVEKLPGGAIVRATGLPPRQGFWMAELVAETDGPTEDGTLAFTFRVAPPTGTTRSGTEPSREVTAGLFLTTQDLAQVRTILVRGARNQRSARR